MTHLYIAIEIVIIISCLFPIHYIHANIEAILFTEIGSTITFHETRELYIYRIVMMSFQGLQRIARDCIKIL